MCSQKQRWRLIVRDFNIPLETQPKMIRFTILTALLAFLAPLLADPIVPSSNLPGAQYPRIESDLRVTFEFKAPNAAKVKLDGGSGLIKQPTDMSRAEDGTWSITTPPAVPGFHYYWFNVDGMRVNDPASYAWFGYGRETSGIEIPEAGVDFYEPKRNIPQGEVRLKSYFSRITGKWRQVHIYTPPS